MSEDRVAGLIKTHLERYPAAGILDVYKLLHQATFGPGHLIADKKAAREWLEHELSTNRPDPAEPLIESIHPDGEIVRLHLRPYLVYGGVAKPLLDAMVRSAAQVKGDYGVMAARWQTFEALCEQGGPNAGRFDLREVRLLGQVRARELWPAVHHSPEYVNIYHPAYRVLTRDEAEAVCVRLGAPVVVV